MFYASLLFCWVAFGGQQCLVAQDTEGPYIKEEECLNRLKEMEFTIYQKVPLSKITAKQCIQQKDGRV